MKTRVITGIVLALVLIPAFIIGGLFLNIILLVLSMGGTYELFRLYNNRESLSPSMSIVYILFSGLLYSLIQSYYLGNLVLEWVFLAIILVLVCAATLLVFVKEFNSQHVGQMLFSVLYPSIGFGAIFGLRDFHLYTLGFLFLITIATDTFAYIIGVNFGKHRLAINISPKKSWEGSFGGTFFAIVLTMLYIWLLKVEVVGHIELTIGVSIILIIFISVVGQIGDLIASKLKRSFDVKDFSNLFPGHGGILDRFDSVLFAGMVLMLISKVVGIL